ncbi:MAG TPA: hypothetical protein VHB21_26760 [Minicystis sp.]|nr:hypothetical protein [Minicystis sp.]
MQIAPTRGPLGVAPRFVALGALVAACGCNAITGVGDLHVTGNGGGDHGASGGSSATGLGGAAGTGGAGQGAGAVGSSASTGVGASGPGVTSSSASAASSTAASSTAASSTGTSMSNDPAQLCVDIINQYRATRGLTAYARWSADEMCVDGEAATDGMMMSPHYAFMHGQTCSAYAQNECPNYASDPTAPNDGIAACLQLMWNEKNQPGCAGCDSCDFPYQNCTNCQFDGPTTVCGHYLNMKSSVLSTVACGFWSGGWYAQDFK